jgi:D-alanyl-lipoteichoic acid acyltransferase DltB (MBOAT superfamily)
LVALLLYTILLHYYTGREIYKAGSKARKKIFLVLGIAGSLGLLGFFKYADFAIAQFNIFGNIVDLGSEIPLMDLALPIGISFYTFQSLSYIIDIYRGNLTPAKTLKEYAIFVAFFPLLVAGPILRARQFLPQLREKMEKFNSTGGLRQLVIQNSNLKLGITIMAFGFFKKVFIADNLTPLTGHEVPVPELESFIVIIRTIALGIQVYCDFSGYSDIAIGAALIFGFKIPRNFNKPFFATSPSDFWSRWHISLSKWVRDYLYFPLVFKNRKSSVVVYSSLMISMLLLGLWHGASWNFIIFGAIHGIFLATHTIIKRKCPQISQHGFFQKNIGKFFSIIITQYFIFLAFLSFRVTEFDHIWYSMQKYVFLDFATEQFIELVSLNQFPVILIIVFFILNFVSYKHGNLQNAISRIKLRYWFSFLGSILMLVLIFETGPAQDFIYFKF